MKVAEYRKLMSEKKMNKYGAIRTEIDGIKFDSAKEAQRYCELKQMERAGLIRSIRLQVKFPLCEARKREDGTTERGASYVADFVYFCGDRMVVEDTKGFRTEAYILKRKWMLDKYGITIQEI